LSRWRGAFSSQAESLGGSENATRQAFSSQAESLGGSENATKQKQGAVLPRAKAVKRL
jgi:hypothetical protein